MIAIIGGGISGLTLAYALQKAGKPYTLFESSSHTGGYIHSVQMGAYLVEQGPNSILIDEDLKKFIHELGLQNELEQASDDNKNRYVYKNGGIRKLPSGPLSFLFSDYFSLKSKKAFLAEPFKPKASSANESVYDFFSRRFSKEITDYAVVPFITGIYAGDTRKLLMKDTFPGILELEEKYGSVVKGIFKKGIGSKRTTASFKGGLQSITNALTIKVTSLRLNAKVTDLAVQPEGIILSIEGKDGIEKHSFEKAVFCTTAFHAGQVLEKSFPEPATLLKKVTYAPVKAFYAAFKRKDVNYAMKGFGMLYPAIEKQFIAGTIWNSSIFTNRCPEDEVLTTSFIGGILNPEYTTLSEEECIARTLAQLKKDLSITGDPTFMHLTGWQKAIPQYDLSLRNSKANLEMFKNKHIYFSSNWTNGLALGACIQNALHLSLEL